MIFFLFFIFSLFFFYWQTNLNASEIMRHKVGNTEDFTEDDIIIHRFKINYGKDDQNPLDHVKFYRKFKENECQFSKIIICHVMSQTTT